MDAADNYLQITLEDEQPILDAKYRLETIYPNILHLEYVRLQNISTDSITAVQQHRIGPHELFTTFFEQINERPLNEKENLLLENVLQELDNTERRS